LVAVSDNDLSALLESMLLSRQCGVRVVGSLAEARADLARGHRDLVIIDSVLSDGDGLELLQEQGTRPRTPRFILLSSYWRRSGRTQPTADELGVTAVVAKPFSNAEMLESIEEVLRAIEEEGPTGKATKKRSSGRSVYAQALAHVKKSFLSSLDSRLLKLTAAVHAAWTTPGPAAYASVLEQAQRMHATAGTHGLTGLSSAVRSVGEVFDELLASDTEPSALLRHRVESALEGARSAADAVHPSAGRSLPASGAWVPASTVHAATLLVVDPDPSFLAAMAGHGREMMIRVVTAASGQEALAIARCTVLDGAMLNIEAGRHGDGVALARELRDLEGCGELPIALHADRDSVETRIDATRLDARIFVAKPVDRTRFGEIARYLGRAADKTRPVVLVANGDDADRLQVFESLLGEGLEVVQLADSKELLDTVARRAVDLVLLADDLTPWNGIQLTRAIRMTPQYKDLPLLLTTALPDAAARLSAFSAGIDDVIVLPARAKELAARVRLRLERLAEQRVQRERDALTSLLLRRAFVERFRGRLAELRRSRGQASIALLDIDHFKRINDELGHLVGDRVLAAFGHALDGNHREEDLCCRWGGEEFVIACFEQDAQTMRTIVQRFLDRFSDRVFQDDAGKPFKVSFSAGVATWPADGDELVTLLKCADERLYEAKGAGRARVV